MKEKEKKVKKTQESPLQKKDVYTIVLEDLRSQFKAFGESLKGLRDKVEDGFIQIDKRFDAIDIKFLKIDADFDIIKEYLSNASDDLDRISAEIKEMKSSSEKIDFGRVDELEKEVEHLKKEINRQGKLIQLKLCA